MVIFIISIVFILLQQKINVNLIKKLAKIKTFVIIVMLSKGTKLLKFNEYKKSDRAPFIIYADLE